MAFNEDHAASVAEFDDPPFAIGTIQLDHLALAVTAQQFHHPVAIAQLDPPAVAFAAGQLDALDPAVAFTVGARAGQTL